jgi:agmatinase
LEPGRTPNLPDDIPGNNHVALLGVPFDEFSSFLRGPALAPARIRHVLHAGSTNWCAENGVDLAASPHFTDAGDLELDSGEAALAQIEAAVGRLLDQGARVISLGGDHSVTLPIVRAYSRKFDGLNILHLDAHPDLYDNFQGNRFSHACPFARIMEEKLAARLVQVGIRTMNPHQQAQADRFQVEVIEMRSWQPNTIFAFDGPVYLSLDLDVLDPGFAPGLSHHEPGGLSPRDVVRIIQQLDGAFVGADIVEYNPVRDSHDITAMVAAKFLKEIAGQMLGPA